MKIIQLLMSLAIVAGGYVSSVHAAEKLAETNMNAFDAMQQTTESIVAPNVFTPNGDGINDIFEVVSSGGSTVSLKVFTRAGVLIFSIEARRCRWDGFSLTGQPMANGVYYYTAEVPGSSPKISKSGFVHLYR